MIAIQVQERSRGCNVAEHGGSTEVCTETQTESRSCNEDCGELNHLFLINTKVQWCSVKELERTPASQFFNQIIQEIHSIQRSKEALSSIALTGARGAADCEGRTCW